MNKRLSSDFSNLHRRPKDLKSLGFSANALWSWAAVFFVGASTLYRLSQLNQLELAPDEAYYWDWSRHLSAGYYDQGPMVAYIIRLTTFLLGTNEFGVRFGVLSASFITISICAYLAYRIANPLAAFLTALFLGVSPFMEVGSIIATYDPFMVCFWALSLHAIYNALFTTKVFEQSRWWAAAGFTSGLGFLSKHTMLLIAPCLVIFLVISPTHRLWLRRPQPYLAFLFSMLLYSGVLWWNAHHHWWTFGHLLFLTTKSFGSPLKRLGDFYGSQALLIGPGLFIAALSSCASIIMHRGIDDQKRQKQLFLVCMGLPILLFFTLMCFKAKVQGNWAPCAWLSITILAAWYLSELTSTLGADLSRRILIITCGIVLTSLLLTVLLINPTLRVQLGIKLPPDADLSNTAYGWKELASHVDGVRKGMAIKENKPVFIAGNGYQYCALMGFYLPDKPETFDLFLHFRLTMYAAYIDRLKLHLGENCVFVNDGEVDDSDLRQIFDRVEWDPPFYIWRRNLYSEPIRTVHIARCYGYKRYVGLEWAVGG